MKTLALAVIALLFLLIGCGHKGGSSGSSSIPDPSPINGSQPVTKNVYRIVVTGDNVQFVSNSFDLDTGYSDHSQYAIAPAVQIPVGQQFELDETAYNLQNLVLQVTNMNGSPAMTAKLYKNGVMMATTTLNAAGDFNAFQNY